MTIQHSAAGTALRKLAAVGAALALLISAGPAVPVAAQVTPASAWFVDHGGPVLRAAQLFLIYWGNAWTAPPPSAPTHDQISRAVETLVTGPYLTGLSQYRDINPASVRGSAVITTSEPPNEFSDDDVTEFLDAQLGTGAVAGPGPDNQTLYYVIMPTGVHSDTDGELAGKHSYYERHDQPIHFVWTADSSSISTATRTMSHELVEAVTDPEGRSVLGVRGSCIDPGWCEIADICETTTLIYGIAVRPYWSNLARDCIAPYLDQADTYPNVVP
jgi:hypothetical protein